MGLTISFKMYWHFSDTLKLIGRTITQPNVADDATINKASAVIENAFKFQIGANEVTEFIINTDSAVAHL